jgi:hypothetical protein
MKKYFLGIVVLMVLCVLAIGPVQAADFWKQKGFRISGTAGEDLSKGDVVCIKDADGEVYQADADDSDLRPAVGVIGHAADEDGTVEIVVQGILAGQSGLAEGDNVYLSDTAGSLTQTAPDWRQKMGVAISGTEYFINGLSAESAVSKAELVALDQSDSSEKSTGVTFVAKALYDVSGGDAGSVGAHGLGVTIPDNAVILDGVIDVITTFTDDDDDSATIAISVEGANDIVTATAISGGSNIWDAGLQDVAPDGTAANMVKTSDDQEVTATVADDALSAGKMWVILRYVITE